MKRLILVLLVTILYSCTDETIYKYKVIYQNGDTEFRYSRNYLRETNNGCVWLHGKVCGIRQLILIEEIKQSPSAQKNED